MVHRQAKLTPEQLQQVAHIEASVQHWSMQHTSLTLKAKQMMDNIEGLYRARSQLLDTIMKEQGIDPATIRQSPQIGPDGVMNLICEDPPAPAPASEANGTAAAPPVPAPAPVAAEQSPTS